MEKKNKSKKHIIINSQEKNSFLENKVNKLVVNMNYKTGRGSSFFCLKKYIKELLILNEGMIIYSCVHKKRLIICPNLDIIRQFSKYYYTGIIYTNGKKHFKGNIPVYMCISKEFQSELGITGSCPMTFTAKYDEKFLQYYLKARIRDEEYKNEI